MTTLAAPSANQIQSTLAASYTRGTDTTVVLVDGSLFPSPTPLGHVIWIRDTLAFTAATKWCLIIYTSRATNTLTMGGGATDYALAKNVTVGDEAYEWPIGSYVELISAADEIAHLFSDKISKTLFDANTILEATTDDTPAALTVAEQTLVGRITAGNIAALSATQARTLLNVEDGADVTDATNVNAAGAVMESDVDAKGDLLVGTADNAVSRLAVGTNDQVLTADSGEATGVKWAAAGGAAQGTAILKTADETVTSSTTLQNDDELFFSVAANENVLFEGDFLMAPGGDPGDMKIGFSYPTGGALYWSGSLAFITWPDTTAQSLTSLASGATAFGQIDATLLKGKKGLFMYIGGANAGTLQTVWAQANSSVTGSTMAKGSVLRIWRAA